MPTVDEMIRRYHAGEYDFVSKKDAGLLVAEIERLREIEKLFEWYEEQEIYCFPIKGANDGHWYMYARDYEAAGNSLLDCLRAARAQEQTNAG